MCFPFPINIHKIIFIPFSAVIFIRNAHCARNFRIHRIASCVRLPFCLFFNRGKRGEKRKRRNQATSPFYFVLSPLCIHIFDVGNDFVEFRRRVYTRGCART